MVFRLKTSVTAGIINPHDIIGSFIMIDRIVCQKWPYEVWINNNH